MKALNLYLFYCLLSLNCLSQEKSNDFVFSHTGGAASTQPFFVIGEKTSNLNYNEQPNAVIQKYMYRIVDGKMSGNFTVSQIFDTSSVLICVSNISDADLGNYEFRVLENNRDEIKPWTTLQALGRESIYTLIFRFKGKKGSDFIFDLRKKKQPEIISSAIILYPTLKPTVKNIFLSDELDFFLKKLSAPFNAKPDSTEKTKWLKKYTAAELDSITGIPKKLHLAPGETSIIFFVSETMNEANQMEYQLNKNGKLCTPWKVNDFDKGFIWLKKLPPGKYELQIRFPIQKENIGTYHFEVLERWDQTVIFKIIAGSLVAAFLAFPVLIFRNKQQRKRLRSIQEKHERTALELRSVYSQLNPHFIFNALSSIQALVNRKETEKANYYLSEFSGLLREFLANNDKEEIPLANEIKVLDSYLRLEQLRFAFHYSITTKGIDPSVTVIPALLLQPVIENAIKHGVSMLHEKGNIEVSFLRKKDDMIAGIRDNGNGFNMAAASTGFGLKLTRERLTLINLQKDINIEFNIETSLSGTQATFCFKNWFI